MPNQVISGVPQGTRKEKTKSNADDGWVTVTRGKHCLPSSNNRFSNGQINHPLSSSVPEKQNLIKTTSEEPISETASCTETSMSDHDSKLALPAKAKTSKAARKNWVRSMRRKVARTGSVGKGVDDELEVEKSKGQLETLNVSEAATGPVKEGLPGVEAMSLFGLCPAEALTLIVSQLPTTNLASLSMTVSQERAVNLANAFTCSELLHKGIEPFQAFHTQEELEGAVKRQTKLLVSQPAISQVLRSLKQSDHAIQQSQSKQSTEESTLSNEAVPDHALKHIFSRQPLEQSTASKPFKHAQQQAYTTPSVGKITIQKQTQLNLVQGEKQQSRRKSTHKQSSNQSMLNQVINGVPQGTQKEKSKSNADDGWLTVRRGKHCLPSSNNGFSNVQINHPLSSLFPEKQNLIKTTSEESISKTASCTETSTSDHDSKLALSAKAKASEAASRQNRSSSMVAHTGSIGKGAKMVDDESEVDKSKGQLETLNVSEAATGPVKEGLQGIEAMGLFGLLPVEVLKFIIAQLPTSDLASFSMTCHGMNEVCEDGFVWKDILYRQFPATSLQAAIMNDWMHAYILKSSNITSSLQCSHSKVMFDKDILGYPITYTVDPRTNCVEFIEVSFDLLSKTAYEEQKVRTTASNETFELLPLYINQEHFERGLPLLMYTACALCPDMKSHTFKPEMVLSFMPKLLNTIVVLLSRNGIPAIDHATDGFCSLHRLFIALCDRFNLWKEAERRVLKFVSSEKARSKAECQSLGHFISLLTVCSSKETSWENVIRPWIHELFDREVIWVCKAYPNLVEKLKVNPKCGGVDEGLLELSWRGCKTGLRLAIFFYGFIHILARPPSVCLYKVAASYEALYGMASLPMKKCMQDFGKRTMGVDNWPTFFEAIGLQTPSKEYITGWLRQSWFSSLQKGYHTNNTNFTAIQKYGVSKILLKGETIHLSVNSTAYMQEKWRFEGNIRHGVSKILLKSETTCLGVNSTMFMREKWRFEGNVKYLDASCLLYDFNGRFIDVVDYAQRSLAGILHSGDQIDYSQNEGTHTIILSLGSLGTQVKEMFFTMSGCMGAQLKDIRLPFVQLVEQKTGKEVCEYHLDDKILGEHRSVIMCRLYRNEPSKSASWHVEAIGHLGAGAAYNYEPIKTWIDRRIRKSREG